MSSDNNPLRLFADDMVGDLDEGSRGRMPAHLLDKPRWTSEPQPSAL